MLSRPLLRDLMSPLMRDVIGGPLAVGAAAWTPASEAPGTFSMWIDGADRPTYTASGGFVSQINDKSGAGNHAMQTDSSLQPIDVTTGFRNDTNRFFSTTLPSNNDNESAFIVLALPSVTAVHTLLGPSGSGSRQFRVDAGNLQVVRAFTAQDASTTGAPVPAGVQCLVEMQLEFNAQTILGVNGILQSATGIRTNSFGAAAASRIGANRDGSEPAVATFREILTLPTKPSTALAGRIRTYLKNKWALP